MRNQKRIATKKERSRWLLFHEGSGIKPGAGGDLMIIMIEILQVVAMALLVFSSFMYLTKRRNKGNGPLLNPSCLS